MGAEEEIAEDDLSWLRCESAERIPVPTVDELWATAGPFSEFTALGSDNWHPRWTRLLCVEGMLAVAKFIGILVNGGCTPTGLQLMIIALLPKPEGGWETG